ncbi:hypothetical protein COCNU_scaffold004099G000020 [Cocos nucifera]|nr:hypothetical protein [Cocos nucifera]
MESQKRETENESGNAKTLESEAVTPPPTAERAETPPAPSLPPAAREELEADPLSAQTTATSEPLAAAPATDLEKKVRRAERFGMPVQLSEEEKRSARAQRFDFLKSLLISFFAVPLIVVLLRIDLEQEAGPESEMKIVIWEIGCVEYGTKQDGVRGYNFKWVFSQNVGLTTAFGVHIGTTIPKAMSRYIPLAFTQTWMIKDSDMFIRVLGDSCALFPLFEFQKYFS